MKLLRNNWTYILGAVVGAIGGYLYWRYVGCTTGTCPITSSPANTIIYGTAMGALLGGIFTKKDRQAAGKKQN